MNNIKPKHWDDNIDHIHDRDHSWSDWSHHLYDKEDVDVENNTPHDCSMISGVNGSAGEAGDFRQPRPSIKIHCGLYQKVCQILIFFIK